MSDKKDFAKQRLSDFLAARLRAKGTDEGQTQQDAPRFGEDGPEPA